MALRSSVLLLTLLIVSLAFSARGQIISQTASATWQVQKYDFDVTLPSDERGREVTVKALLNLKNISGRPATTLTLRMSPSASVSTVKINDAPAEPAKGEEKITTGSNFQRLVMRFAPVAPDGTVTAAVDYKIDLKDNTSLASVSPTGSQLLPLSFWYPTPNSWYFTRGADAAPVRMRVHAPAGQSVVSAGAETAGAFDSAGSGQPFFVSGNWERSDQNGVAVYIPKGSGPDALKRAAELGALVTDARAYVNGILATASSAPLRIVASRRGAGFSSGGTFIVSDAVFRRPKIDSLTAMNIAEGMAKLSIGNAIHVNGDGYGAVSEGLTRYLANQFLENKFGKDVSDVERARQRFSYAAISKRDAPLSSVSPLDPYYYPAVANKGAMAWRILGKRVGTTEFWKAVRAAAQDGDLTLAELRSAFPEQKDLLDYLFDQVTDMNLLAGVPQSAGAETRVALHNTGSADATVDVAATTATGEKMVATTSIRATSFGEVTFRSPSKIVRAEIDVDKMYPQTDYSDDIAPREIDESDPLLAVKRLFDKQDFAGAETAARSTLRDLSRYDDVRILLARALLGENKTAEAEREFKAVLDEKLPTSRSIAWAFEGLAEVAAKANQTEPARRYAESAIIGEGDYGAGLASRNVRNKLGAGAGPDPTVKAFFADFDKAAAANRKVDVDALVLPGEVTKFAGGVAGSAQQWQTDIRQIDRLDADTVLVEANMTVKLLSKEPESDLAVYRLVKTAAGWRLAGVEIFETR